jgi:hypothetical protein
MKTLFFLCFAVMATIPARAEIFRSDAARGSRHGGVHRDRGHHNRTSVHVGIGSGHRHRYDGPWRDYGHGHGNRGYYHSPYRHLPRYSYYDGFGSGYPYFDTYGYYGAGSGATNGLLLGALAGGVIGHNSGEFRHNGWRGAAWGAGLGWVLGSVADANRRRAVYETAPVVIQPAPAVQAQPQPASAPPAQPITIINNYYNTGTPMSSANGLFGR